MRRANTQSPGHLDEGLAGIIIAKESNMDKKGLSRQYGEATVRIIEDMTPEQYDAFCSEVVSKLPDMRAMYIVSAALVLIRDIVDKAN